MIRLPLLLSMIVFLLALQVSVVFLPPQDFALSDTSPGYRSVKAVREIIQSFDSGGLAVEIANCTPPLGMML